MCEELRRIRAEEDLADEVYGSLSEPSLSETEDWFLEELHRISSLVPEGNQHDGLEEIENAAKNTVWDPSSQEE